MLGHLMGTWVHCSWPSGMPMPRATPAEGRHPPKCINKSMDVGPKRKKTVGQSVKMLWAPAAVAAPANAAVSQ